MPTFIVGIIWSTYIESYYCDGAAYAFTTQSLYVSKGKFAQKYFQVLILLILFYRSIKLIRPFIQIYYSVLIVCFFTAQLANVYIILLVSESIPS